MTAHVVSGFKSRRKAAGAFMLPLAAFAGVFAAVGAVLAYVLWPSWPNAPIALDAPGMPVTVSGVLFDVPPAAIRAAVQRHPGAHERIDLAFLWPSLTPPQPDGKGADQPVAENDGEAAAKPLDTTQRLFVTIAGLGTMLPPAELL